MGNPRKSAEANLMRQEGELSFMELAEKSQRQAEMALDSAELATIITSQVQNIVNPDLSDSERELVCAEIAKNNISLMPDHIEDEIEQAAYILALGRAILSRQAKSN